MAVRNAQQIRTDLKLAGYNRTRVSVRNHSYSMGSTVYVTIKDATADFDLVKAIAEGYKKVRRCTVTGDILGGGNSFVEVSYSDEAKEVIGQEMAYIADLLSRESFNELEVGECIRIGAFSFYKTSDRYSVDLLVEGQEEPKYFYLEEKIAPSQLFRLAMISRDWNAKQDFLLNQN